MLVGIEFRGFKSIQRVPCSPTKTRLRQCLGNSSFHFRGKLLSNKKVTGLLKCKSYPNLVRPVSPISFVRSIASSRESTSLKLLRLKTVLKLAILYSNDLERCAGREGIHGQALRSSTTVSDGVQESGDKTYYAQYTKSAKKNLELKKNIKLMISGRCTGREGIHGQALRHAKEFRLPKVCKKEFRNKKEYKTHDLGRCAGREGIHGQALRSSTTCKKESRLPNSTTFSTFYLSSDGK